MNGTLLDLRTAIPPDILSTDAIAALRTLHDAGVAVDAEVVGQADTRGWLIYIEGMPLGFSPAAWEAFYRQWLALRHRAGQLDAAYWLFICEMHAEAATAAAEARRKEASA